MHPNPFHGRRWRHLVLGLFIGALVGVATAVPTAGAAVTVPYQLASDLPYRDSASAPDDYARERCTLDVYAPTGEHNLPVVVWFHGGGLTAGAKAIPEHLKEQRIVVIAANYRLLPRATISDCIDDAAAAVAWAFQHAEQYGGNRRLIFVAGHSAGGYLAAMVTMDAHWLAGHGVAAADLAGLFDISGQCITHFALRESRGQPATQAVVDQFAPLYFVRKELPPILLVTGDRELELFGRYEENAYFWRMLKLAGHPRVILHELQGFDHGGVGEPAQALILRYLREFAAERGEAKAGAGL